MKRDSPVHGVGKIPDAEFIKHLRTEIGKSNAYINELEHRLEKCKRDNLTNKIISKLEQKIRELENKIRKYQRGNRIDSGNSTEFENWIKENSISPIQRQKLVQIIKKA
jgi:hypothetical protein